MLNVQYSLVNMYSIQGLYRCLKMLEFDPEKSRTIGRTRNSVVDFGLEFLMKYKEVQVRENNDQLNSTRYSFITT